MGTQASTTEATVTQIAPGVRRVSVGSPFRSRVYSIDGPEAPIAVDAATTSRGPGTAILTAAGGRLGRVILSHSPMSQRV